MAIAGSLATQAQDCKPDGNKVDKFTGAKSVWWYDQVCSSSLFNGGGARYDVSMYFIQTNDTNYQVMFQLGKQDANAQAQATTSQFKAAKDAKIYLANNEQKLPIRYHSLFYITLIDISKLRTEYEEGLITINEATNYVHNSIMNTMNLQNN